VSGPFDGWLGMLTFATALGCGLVSGVFFAFSTFVMPALARLPAAQGMAAMKAINVAAITPSFMAALLGTGAASVVLAGVCLLDASPLGAGYVLAGSLVYVVGTILVTIVVHVPRNDALAATDEGNEGSAEGALLWAGYLATWTAWNHARAFAAFAAAALLTMALS
jgi:uncharacterized membrane protein